MKPGKHLARTAGVKWPARVLLLVLCAFVARCGLNPQTDTPSGDKGGGGTGGMHQEPGNGGAFGSGGNVISGPGGVSAGAGGGSVGGAPGAGGGPPSVRPDGGSSPTGDAGIPDATTGHRGDAGDAGDSGAAGDATTDSGDSATDADAK